jgi:hypothetical protein
MAARNDQDYRRLESIRRQWGPRETIGDSTTHQVISLRLGAKYPLEAVLQKSAATLRCTCRAEKNGYFRQWIFRNDKFERIRLFRLQLVRATLCCAVTTALTHKKGMLPGISRHGHGALEWHKSWQPVPTLWHASWAAEFFSLRIQTHRYKNATVQNARAVQPSELDADSSFSCVSQDTVTLVPCHITLVSTLVHESCIQNNQARSISEFSEIHRIWCHLIATETKRNQIIFYSQILDFQLFIIKYM